LQNGILENKRFSARRDPSSLHDELPVVSFYPFDADDTVIEGLGYSKFVLGFEDRLAICSECESGTGTHTLDPLVMMHLTGASCETVFA
jgi:hypothetical protein